jgi:8-oxo-(d)GTP phosphatase
VSSPEIVAAGAVIGRKGRQVLLVHRPRYDDWSFPKGKLDPDEHVLSAAVREVAEETGLDVRLGPPLPDQEYLVGNGTLRLKRVHYWVGRVVGEDDITTYRPNDEIDQLRWLPYDDARALLSYERDRDTFEAFLRLRKRSTPLVVLRHAKAEARKTWDGDDRARPLSPEGAHQAERLVPLLAAYGVQRVVTSSSLRCSATVAPYADLARLKVECTRVLSEEDADDGGVERVVQELMSSKVPAVLCTHRPVLPSVLAVAGLRDPRLDAGGFLVAHHRNGQIVASEVHNP